MHHSGPVVREQLVFHVVLGSFLENFKHGLLIFVSMIEFGEIAIDLLDLVFRGLAVFVWNHYRVDLVGKISFS